MTRWSRTMDVDGCRDEQIQGISHTRLLTGAHEELWQQHKLFDALRLDVPKAA